MTGAAATAPLRRRHLGPHMINATTACLDAARPDLAAKLGFGEPTPRSEGLTDDCFADTLKLCGRRRRNPQRRAEFVVIQDKRPAIKLACHCTGGEQGAVQNQNTGIAELQWIDELAGTTAPHILRQRMISLRPVYPNKRGEAARANFVKHCLSCSLLIGRDTQRWISGAAHQSIRQPGYGRLPGQRLSQTRGLRGN